MGDAGGTGVMGDILQLPETPKLFTLGPFTETLSKGKRS